MGDRLPQGGGDRTRIVLALAGQFDAFERDGLPIGYVARRNGLIDALTLDAVKRAAARLFDPKRLTVVVGGSIRIAGGGHKLAKKPASHP